MKFRFKALEKQRQPDQLDSPLLLASPRGWVALFVVLITAVGVGLWGFLGAIPRSAAVSGLITYPGGIVAVESSVSGALVRLPVSSGQQVRTGQTLGTVRTPTGEVVSVGSPSDGRVVSIASAVGNFVNPGDALVQIERVGSEESQLGATLVVTGDMVPFVHPGQEVSLAVPGVNPRIFGRLRGEVVRVSDFPASSAQLGAVTGYEHEETGNSYLVTVRLVPDERTASGFGWTSVSGPPVQIQSRTPVTGEVSLGSVKPVSVLLGV